MRVKFVAHSKVLGYRPGVIYEDDLYPLLEAILRKDVHLRLIDPPSLDPTPEPEPEPVKEVPAHGKSDNKDSSTAKKSGKTPRQDSGDGPSTKSGERPIRDSNSSS